MICKYCGCEMIEGLIICPNCLKNAPTYNPVKELKKSLNNGKKCRSDFANRKNDEINQWYDMGLF